MKNALKLLCSLLGAGVGENPGGSPGLLQIPFYRNFQGVGGWWNMEQPVHIFGRATCTEPGSLWGVLTTLQNTETLQRTQQQNLPQGTLTHTPWSCAEVLKDGGN